jgi:ABC-2 type transport system ATP-binding protein
MKAAIEVSQVRKRFDKFVAVDDLSFDVPRGSIFGLLGPNGAGKTTTIRMIMNITAPDSGEIRILGEPMSRATQNRIGYLPEERGLYRKMRVLDHLLFLCDIKGVPREEAKQRISGWLDALELRPWLKKKVDELSKGMQQKIQFIATIVHDPEILILDEPFSGLDPINTGLIKTFLQEFRSKNKTIIFSTHVLEQAEKLCDEICLLTRSKKILEGGMRDLKKRYARNVFEVRTGATADEIRRFPGVTEVTSENGCELVSLGPNVSAREFLRQLIDRHDVSLFAEKEPELEEIYLEAVRSAGIEDTRTIG